MEISINLQNCFGIKEFNHKFSFDKNKVQLIYAPNGTMKTSFSNTMKFLSEQSKIKPKDLLNEESKAVYEVKVDGINIEPKSIFVADCEEEYDPSHACVNILASAKLKQQYDDIYNSLSAQKQELISKLVSVSRSSDCEKELVHTFKQNDDDTIFSVLEKLSEEVEEGMPYYDFKYNDIFDKGNKIKDFIEKHKENLKTYFDQYKSLLENSTFFKSSGDYVFGTYQATQLENSVKDGHFFGVNHKITLCDGREIKTNDDLIEIIEKEKKQILNNAKLQKTFETITKSIDKNEELRGLKSILETHPDWVLDLLNYEEFRKKVWKGHLSKNELLELLRNYNKAYQEKKAELQKILNAANEEQDRWKDIINIYNARFHVPFIVSIENQKDVVLNMDGARLNFSYVDGNGKEYPKEKKQLLAILSKGEQRAFAIMQLLFEFESRKSEKQASLIIMDDIADSFDYQNKYAIIEYIKDLASDANNTFNLIILTHNYDFYRTVSSRLNIGGKNLHMAQRLPNDEIKISQGQYKGDIYANVFLKQNDNPKIFISMIPFVRNLIEYTKGAKDKSYLLLTSCLHHKSDTKDITEEQVIDIMNDYTQGSKMMRQRSETKIYSTIIGTANNIINEQNIDSIKIENKIVLSIAIRILAEEYLFNKLTSASFKADDLFNMRSPLGNWTGEYKKHYPDDPNKYIIEKVNMMTPEVIHVNSFMFEPLIDMSIYHLKKLYKDIKKISKNELN